MDLNLVFVNNCGFYVILGIEEINATLLGLHVENSRNVMDCDTNI
jgi:hypothetical protein